MADKLNSTGLQYLINRLKVLFAHQSDLDALQDQVDELITEGGEPNVIETVKVNGTALTPTDKAVDVTVPTAVSDLTNDGDGDSPFATEAYVGTNGGKIDTIKVNGTAQTITNKEVDITVPTAVSDLSDASDYALAANIPTDVSELTNDAGYQTASDVDTKISAATTSIYRYKGSVATKTALPNNAENGDVYDVQSNGINYAWNGTSWDPLGSEFDATAFWRKDELVAITTAEIDAMLADE